MAEFFDIKFCPDQPLNNDPVFAAVSKKQVSPPAPGPVRPELTRVVGRDMQTLVQQGRAKSLRDHHHHKGYRCGLSLPYRLLHIVLTWAKDAAENCCCTWSKDPETGRPLICVAGQDAKIKVYDVVNGELAAVGCPMF